MNNIKIVATNRKVNFEYFILAKLEAGIKLTGTEIKSVRMGKININDSYVIIKHGTPYILNMHIAKYEKGNIFNHDETRLRELLLHKHEALKLYNRVKLESLAIVPLKAYFKGGLLKIEIGLCKGKKLYDKRESIKEQDLKRKTQKALKDYR